MNKEISSIFYENKTNLQIAKEQEIQFKDFVKYHMPGCKYLSCRSSYSSTRYVIECDPQMITFYTGKKIERQLDASFDINGCVISQDGKKLVIDVPNKRIDIFHFKNALEVIDKFDYKKDNAIKAYAGEFVKGEPNIINFNDSKSILIGGMTGSGKSVCLHNILVSMLLGYSEKELIMYMIDGKDIELTGYKGIPQVIEETGDKEEAVKVTKHILNEIDRRKSLLNKDGYRSLSSYNKDMSENDKLPEIMLIIEEVDILFQKESNSDITTEHLYKNINTIIKQGRFVGIHIIFTSQRPSAKSIGTDIRSQIGGIIALKVKEKIDSTMILGTKDAVNLNGNGDAYLKRSDNVIERFQCSIIDDDELRKVQKYLKTCKPES